MLPAISKGHPLSSWVCESTAQTPQHNQAMSRQPDTCVLFVGANIPGIQQYSEYFTVPGTLFEREVYSGMGI